MAAESGYESPDEWEIINDGCFVYKRKKRLALEHTASAPPPPDPTVERKNRRERKKWALLKLKDRYLKEISRWEFLSNRLKETEHKAQSQFLERQELCSTTSSDGVSSSEEHTASDSTRRRLVDDLISQVDAQEAIISNITNLCDVAEALCNAREERMQQQLADLPVWGSPRELMDGLCD